MQTVYFLFLFFLAACAAPGKPGAEPPVFGTRQALETELAAVGSELTQLDSLIANAHARIKQYRQDKPKGADGLIIGAEAEIHNHQMRKASLRKRKNELEAQIRRQR